MSERQRANHRHSAGDGPDAPEPGFSPAHSRFPTGAGPADMWRMLDLVTPTVLRAVAALRLPDRVAHGPATVDSLARTTGTDPDTLARVLRYLTARGVFEIVGDGGAAGPVVARNDASDLLRDEHPAGIRRWIDPDGFGGALDGACLRMLDVLRTGRAGAGSHRDALDGARAASYDTAMAALSRAQAPAVVAAADWTGLRHVVDLGGGTGALLAEALRRDPELRGTLVELPEVAEAGRAQLAAAGLAERTAVVGGDAFTVDLPAADAYLLKFVVHTVDDDAAGGQLGRCGAVTPRVLVVERVDGPTDPGGAVFTAMDLRMLALGGGRERTEAEYDALAATAGLVRVATVHTAVGPSVLEYRTR